MTESSTTDVTYVFLHDEDPDVRRHAAEELAAMGDNDSIATLARGLEDANKGVRDAAMSALCRIGGPAVAVHTAALIDHSLISTRNAAAEVLLRLGADAVDALIPYVKSPNHDVRKFAVDILGLTGCPEIIDQIAPLADDPDENVVIAAVEALGNLGTSRGIPALLAVYREKEYARICVAEALGKTQNGDVSGFLLGELKRAYDNPESDPLLQFALTEALGHVGDLEAYSYLLTHISGGNISLKRSLVYSLIQIAARWQEPLPQSEAMKEHLFHALETENFGIRQGAAKALSEYDADDVTRALICALDGPAVFDTLLLSILLNRPGVFDIALDVLENENERSNKPIVTLIGQIGERQKALEYGEPQPAPEQFRRAIDLMIRHWDAANEETRSAIVDALFRLDGTAALEFLDRLADDPDPWLRMQILELLATVYDPRARDFIARFLEDEHDMVRDVAMGLMQGSSADPDPAGEGSVL